MPLYYSTSIILDPYYSLLHNMGEMLSHASISRRAHI